MRPQRGARDKQAQEHKRYTSGWIVTAHGACNGYKKGLATRFAQFVVNKLADLIFAQLKNKIKLVEKKIQIRRAKNCPMVFFAANIRSLAQVFCFDFVTRVSLNGIARF